MNGTSSIVEQSLMMAQLIAQVCENVNPANHGQPGHFVRVPAIRVDCVESSLDVYAYFSDEEADTAG